VRVYCALVEYVLPWVEVLHGYFLLVSRLPFHLPVFQWAVKVLEARVEWLVEELAVECGVVEGLVVEGAAAVLLEVIVLILIVLRKLQDG